MAKCLICGQHSCICEKTPEVTTHKKRGSILMDAYNIINGERQDIYGNPEDSFQTIADYWSTYLRLELTPLTKKDVAIMMALLKIARESHQHNPDNLTDACGYLGLKSDME